MIDEAAILDGVHVMGNAQTRVSLQICDNPLCGKQFKPTCLPWAYQLYCQDSCKQQASLIRRVAYLFRSLPDGQAIEILRRVT